MFSDILGSSYHSLCLAVFYFILFFYSKGSHCKFKNGSVFFSVHTKRHKKYTFWLFPDAGRA